MRETITGTLHVIRTKKPLTRGRPSLVGLVLTATLREMDRKGELLEPLPEWPPTYYINTDRPVDRPGGAKRGRLYTFRFRGHHYAKLDREMEGWTITVRATLVPWGNGNGAYLDRPQILDVHERLPDEPSYGDSPRVMEPLR